MRLVVISDTHGLHNRIEGLPNGDVLVHAGDFMNSGRDLQEVVSFNRWLGEQPFTHRVVCGGNHDRYFEASPQQARALLTNAIYLENTGSRFATSVFGDRLTLQNSLIGHSCILAARPRGTGIKFRMTSMCSSPTAQLSEYSTKLRPEKRTSGAKSYSGRSRRRGPRFICSGISTGVPELLGAEPPAS